MAEVLFGGNGRKDDLSYEGVRVVDPTEGIDETLDLTIEAGVITKIEPGSGANGRVVAPAFVDPHVHLRTPGREDEEDIASGTKAAAAGGWRQRNAAAQGAEVAEKGQHQRSAQA